jgi:hypothetical protein
MGRPPIGDGPMSAAERKQRQRDKAFRDTPAERQRRREAYLAATSKPKAEATDTSFRDTDAAPSAFRDKAPPATTDRRRPKLPAGEPEDWTAAEALKVWFEHASDEEREEFAGGLSHSDLDTLLFAASTQAGFGKYGGYPDWLHSLGYFEGTRYVKLPAGINEYELDKWLRDTCGKGLDED